MIPSIVPSASSTPSFSRCAIRIVRLVENPSLRLASCVSVEVVNGGAGRSTPGRSSTAVTSHGRCASSASASAVASCSLRCRTPLAESRPVSESKSLPVATRSSPTRVSAALNSRRSAESVAAISQ